MIVAPELEHLFSYSAVLADPQQMLGDAPMGTRMIALVTGVL